MCIIHQAIFQSQLDKGALHELQKDLINVHVWNFFMQKNFHFQY